MCGIAGIVAGSPGPAESLKPVLSSMSWAVRHRGPDSDGIWIDPASGVGMAHRRLAILDLSPTGHQPMRSACGRFVIVFNGEIYNYLELRELLLSRGCRFTGGSDTEVMLAAFSEWGIKESISRFNGMFAFAVWDFREQMLTLARDRIGEKPLFYGTVGRDFLFASELRAFNAHPDFDRRIDTSALCSFLRFSNVPSPASIFQSIRKLPPASILSLRRGCLPQLSTYWSLSTNEHVDSSSPYDEEALIDQMESMLLDSVRRRMISDVPLGAFLSGGIDSSTIVALMRRCSNRPVRTFSIGFHDRQYNEAHEAASIARHLGTEHTELYVTASDALRVIPELPQIYDEPFADSSQIPTLLVSRLARGSVSVSLSGDGGDELFAGYNRHVWVERLVRGRTRLPARIGRLLPALITSVSAGSWDSLFGVISPILPARLHVRTPGVKLHKLAEILGHPSEIEIYRALTARWASPEEVVLGRHEPEQPIPAWENLLARLDAPAAWMTYLDLVTYLPNDVLVKLDRATMSVGLEGRVPLLDHRVIEYVFGLPISMRVRNGQGKWILRQILGRYLPSSLISRPKMGFAIPIGKWLRGPLREWAEALLDEKLLREQGYFSPRPILKQWAEHIDGSREREETLWSVLMFQSWLQAYIGGDSAAR